MKHGLLNIIIIPLSILLFLTSFNTIHDHPGSCIYRIKKNDNDHSREHIVMQQELLVEYTPQELIKIGNYNRILSIDVVLEKDGDRYLVSLINRFYSKKTFDLFGKIKEGKHVRLELLNGSNIYLRHLGNSELSKSKNNQEVEFSSGFALNKKDIKTLRKNEIESIGIFWETGFETFEIYDIDVFRDQLNCLTKIN